LERARRDAVQNCVRRILAVQQRLDSFACLRTLSVRHHLEERLLAARAAPVEIGLAALADRR
jgi:hypothetical protein